MIEEINKHFEEGCKLKEIARKSVDNIDRYIDAAKNFKEAGFLLKEWVASVSGADEKVSGTAYSSYYLYEEQHCLSTFYYEKRDLQKAREHLNNSKDLLDDALKTLEQGMNAVSDKQRIQLRQNFEVWNSFKQIDSMFILSIEARDAWDKEDIIKALDYYRIIGEKCQQIIENVQTLVEKNVLGPEYLRVAKGNYVGQMVNISSSMAKIVYQKMSLPLGTQDISFRLIRHFLEAYRFSNQAFNENPEWDQYRQGAEIILENIETFLKPKFGDIFYH